MLKTLFALAFLAAIGSALVCFENDDEESEPKLVSKKEWKQCMYIPPMRKGAFARQAGVSEAEDSLEGIAATFAQGDDTVYKILSVCIYERYDFGAVSPKLRHRVKPEFMFRCFCNTNNCNRAENFEQFLGNLAISRSD